MFLNFLKTSPNLLIQTGLSPRLPRHPGSGCLRFAKYIFRVASPDSGTKPLGQPPPGHPRPAALQQVAAGPSPCVRRPMAVARRGRRGPAARGRRPGAQSRAHGDGESTWVLAARVRGDGHDEAAGNRREAAVAPRRRSTEGVPPPPHVSTHRGMPLCCVVDVAVARLPSFLREGSYLTVFWKFCAEMYVKYYFVWACRCGVSYLVDVAFPGW